MSLASSVQFSRSVASDSLRPHESQHARPPCPSPTPGVHPNSCPSSRWCHPPISSSVVPFSSCPPIPPSIRVFSNESTLHMRWPEYWSFSLSISPSTCLVVSNSVTPRTVAHQAPLSMGFSRQESWSVLPCLPPGDLPDPGIEPWSPSFFNKKPNF